MKSGLPYAIVFFLGLAASSLQAQSQSQVGLNLGRQWLNEACFECGWIASGLSTGLFFHHQFKDHLKQSSSLGVVAAVDYMHFQGERPAFVFVPISGPEPLNYDITHNFISMRFGLAVNLNKSREERLQVYLQGGYLFVHELNGTSTLIYSDGSRGDTQQVTYFRNSKWQHNAYAAIDLRYRIDDSYFAGLSTQFSSMASLNPDPFYSFNVGAVLTVGCILRSKAEAERMKQKRQEKVF